MKLKAPNTNPVDVNLEALYHGNAFVKINIHNSYVMLVAPRDEMIGELKRLLRTLEPKTVEQAALAAALPIELYRPETAWPWLANRFPWLFSDINTATEPYASYLRIAGRKCARDGCEAIVTAVTAIYCSPACKQAAYRERKAA